MTGNDETKRWNLLLTCEWCEYQPDEPGGHRMVVTRVWGYNDGKTPIREADVCEACWRKYLIFDDPHIAWFDSRGVTWMRNKETGGWIEKK